ncbi:hypothetical protein ABID96_002620 [Bacillus sp. OAE603]
MFINKWLTNKIDLIFFWLVTILTLITNFVVWYIYDKYNPVNNPNIWGDLIFNIVSFLYFELFIILSAFIGKWDRLTFYISLTAFLFYLKEFAVTINSSESSGSTILTLIFAPVIFLIYFIPLILSAKIVQYLIRFSKK